MIADETAKSSQFMVSLMYEINGCYYWFGKWRNLIHMWLFCKLARLTFLLFSRKIVGKKRIASSFSVWFITHLPIVWFNMHSLMLMVDLICSDLCVDHRVLQLVNGYEKIWSKVSFKDKNNVLGCTFTIPLIVDFKDRLMTWMSICLKLHKNYLGGNAHSYIGH